MNATTAYCNTDTVAVLATQGYRRIPTAPGCAHGLRRGSCRTCGLYPHRDGCDHHWLDHGLIMAKGRARYLYTWLYQNADRAEAWATRYAEIHGLTFRINHPDDVDAYCPGVTAIRYHREDQPCA